MSWFDSNKEKVKAPPHKVKKNYLVLYAGLSLGLMGMGYFISPYGKVGDLLVEGESTVPDQLIIDASTITSKQTVLGTVISEAAIEAEIINVLPQIKNITIQWSGLNDVIIEAQDYETIAYLTQDNHYQNILENGIILNEVRKIPIGNKPLLTDFEQGPILNEFIDSFTVVDKDIKNSISEIQYMGTKTNPYKISVYMNDGNQITAIITDFANKIVYYPDILQKLEGKKGVIDMEVGVYFKPFDSKIQNEIEMDDDSE